MKRLFSIVIAAFLIASGTGFPLVSANAAVKVGAKCTKANELIKSNSKILACTKSGTKLIWKAASAAQIAKFKAQELAKNTIALGAKGPGGGTVFYDAGSTKPWGRYLEVAPDGWNPGGDPSVYWCNLAGEIGGPVPETGKAIGEGASNTDLIVKMCNVGAAIIARAYRGGGKSDWFLPSVDELTALCFYVNGQTPASSPDGCGHGKYKLDVTTGDYWTSTAASGQMAWTRSLVTGGTSAAMWNWDYYGPSTAVRPIRAF